MYITLQRTCYCTLNTLQYSETSLLYALGNQTIHVTCFIATVALLQGSGARPTISLRHACMLHNFRRKHILLSVYYLVHIMQSYPIILATTYGFVFQSLFYRWVNWNSQRRVTCTKSSSFQVTETGLQPRPLHDHVLLKTRCTGMVVKREVFVEEVELELSFEEVMEPF